MLQKGERDVVTELKPPMENRLLKHMLRADYALLAPHLVQQEFALRYEIEKPNTPVRDIIFLESGLASSVVRDTARREFEVAIAGFEGMTGVSVVLGAQQTPYSTYMQIAGKGHLISSTALRNALAQSATLRTYLLLYVQAQFVQMTSNALATHRCLVDARLARWLLMLGDRTSGGNVCITHDFLSIMVGTRRPYITATLQSLEDRRLIRSKRGQITIVDRLGLIHLADGSYGIAEKEYKRLFGLN